MNVYDFDKTIFRGDSTARFYIFCLKRNPKIWKRVPRLAFEALTVLPRRKQLFKQHMFGFLKDLDDPEKAVTEFWDANQKYMKQWYLSQKQSDDLIISASPEFLIRPIMKRLGVSNVLASPVDIYTGLYGGRNCHGEEKLNRYRIYARGQQIDRFYSDSKADQPLAGIAKEAFLVKGEKLLPWGK